MLKDNYALIGVGFLIAMIVFVLMRQQAKEVEGFYSSPNFTAKPKHECPRDSQVFYDSWIRRGNICSQYNLASHPDDDVCTEWKHPGNHVKAQCDPHNHQNITNCIGPNWRKGYAERCNKDLPELSTPPPTVPPPTSDPHFTGENLRTTVGLKQWALMNGTEINRWCVDNGMTMQPGQHCQVDCSPYIHGFKENNGKITPKKRWQRNERGRKLYKQKGSPWAKFDYGKNGGADNENFNGNYSQYCIHSGFTQK